MRSSGIAWALSWVGVMLLCGAAEPTTSNAIATTKPAAEFERIMPLTVASAGDWVAYRTLDGAQRLTVVHTTQLLADIEVRTLFKGKMIGQPAVRSMRQESDYARDLAESEGAVLEIGRATIHAAGCDWDCQRSVARWKVGATSYERRIWMSPEIPIYGLARMELEVDGKITARMELTGIGRGTATSQPN